MQWLASTHKHVHSHSAPFTQRSHRHPPRSNVSTNIHGDITACRTPLMDQAQYWSLGRWGIPYANDRRPKEKPLQQPTECGKLLLRPALHLATPLRIILQPWKPGQLLRRFQRPGRVLYLLCRGAGPAERQERGRVCRRARGLFRRWSAAARGASSKLRGEQPRVSSTVWYSCGETFAAQFSCGRGGLRDGLEGASRVLSVTTIPCARPRAGFRFGTARV